MSAAEPPDSVFSHSKIAGAHIGEKRILLAVATYNERDNVHRIITEVRCLPHPIDILFVDDNSPDGTGSVLDDIAARTSGIFVYHRPRKLGVGSAHQVAIQWAAERGYDRIVTMDADLSHSPADIEGLIRLGTEADVVVGSRFRQRDSLSGWNVLRKSLTLGGHLLTRVFLRLPYDASGAFRLYRLDRIPLQLFRSVCSPGYGFFVESLHLLHLNGFQIQELPIRLPPRTYGSSKMNWREISKTLTFIFTAPLRRLISPEVFRVVPALSSAQLDRTLNDSQGWQQYWKHENHAGRLLYDMIASVYRKLFIRPTLHRVIEKHFSKGQALLHAGCGSGQVDTSLRSFVDITALDISENALEIYRKVNGPDAKVVHGSISNMHVSDQSLDGIYNLGVMEHFTECEIQSILKEFKRVLRPGGKLVIFWPPEFGLSVSVFKALRWVLENIFGKKDVVFHPDEVTRLRSKEHAERIFRRAGFELIETIFGPRDLFVQMVVVARKPEVPDDLQERPARQLANR